MLNTPENRELNILFWATVFVSVVVGACGHIIYLDVLEVLK